MVVLGVGIWLLTGVLSRFDVTVNGETVTLSRGATIQTILDKKIVEPAPGDLLAVDGSLLTKGGGDICAATIDGEKAGLDSAVSANNVVEITDGEDTTEEADVTEEKIEYKTREGDRSFEAYWYGSIHLLSDGEDGLQTTKTGKESGKTVSEITKEPIDAGYRIYTAQPEDKVIALTFDDGPWPDSTEGILDILEEYNAKATFFTIGNQIEECKDDVIRAHKMGCQILTHTWDHAAGSGGGTSIANMSSSEQVQEIKKGYAAIEDLLGEEPDHIIRAPGGNFYGDVISNVWDIVDAEIGWDVDTEDWRRPGTDSILNMILSAKSGQVVLMHDGGGDRSQTVEALSEAMPTLVEKGYKFVTVNELLAYGMPSSKSDIPSTTSDDEDADANEEKDSESDSGSSSSTSSDSSSSNKKDSSESTSDEEDEKKSEDTKEKDEDSGSSASSSDKSSSTSSSSKSSDSSSEDEESN